LITPDTDVLCPGPGSANLAGRLAVTRLTGPPALIGALIPARAFRHHPLPVS